MRGVFSNANYINLFLMTFPHMSLHSNLVPVQHQGYQYGLLCWEVWSVQTGLVFGCNMCSLFPEPITPLRGVSSTASVMVQLWHKVKQMWMAMCNLVMPVYYIPVVDKKSHLEPSVIIKQSYFAMHCDLKCFVHWTGLSGLDSWSALGQDTLLSQCLSPPRWMNGYCQL